MITGLVPSLQFCNGFHWGIQIIGREIPSPILLEPSPMVLIGYRLTVNMFPPIFATNKVNYFPNIIARTNSILHSRCYCIFVLFLTSTEIHHLVFILENKFQFSKSIVCWLIYKYWMNASISHLFNTFISVTLHFPCDISEFCIYSFGNQCYPFARSTRVVITYVLCSETVKQQL